jgi:hypothetical protein
MNQLIKITFIEGLSEIVTKELETFPSFQIMTTEKDCIYLNFHESITDLLAMKSILNIFLVIQDPNIHPAFLHNHKSVLGNLIEQSLAYTPAQTFKIFCAGSDSPEINDLRMYIQNHFKLISTEETESADKKIIIAKINSTWEIAVSVHSQPLSMRSYRTEHLIGSMNPTIAYAMNQLVQVTSAKSYLNIFSGAGTLLIEAMEMNQGISPIGFDYDSKRISASIQNIKRSGYIKNISVKQADIFDHPNFGIFDSITSDMPFGMQISKDKNLADLYATTINYCENHINTDGYIVLYTTETTLLENILDESSLILINKIPLKIISSENSYLYPAIFVCKKSP